METLDIIELNGQNSQLVKFVPSAIAVGSIALVLVNPLLGLVLAAAAGLAAVTIGRHPGRLALTQTVLLTLAPIANIGWFVLALPAAIPSF